MDENKQVIMSEETFDKVMERVENNGWWKCMGDWQDSVTEEKSKEIEKLKKRLDQYETRFGVI